MRLTGFRHQHHKRHRFFKHHRTPWVSIIGNPNSGKTAIFNRLTGLHHKIGNYPGVTVERKIGRLKNHKILVEDLPGTYSLNAQSMDEKIVADFVQSWREPDNRPNAIIVVLDATNLSRNIYLALQILDWNIPTVIVLNMMDEVKKLGIQIDLDLLRHKLNNDHIIQTCAKDGLGIEEIIETVIHLCMALPISAFHLGGEPFAGQCHLIRLHRRIGQADPGHPGSVLIGLGHGRPAVLPDEIRRAARAERPAGGRF